MSQSTLMEHYQALLQAGQSDEAQRRLELALQIPDQRPVALVSAGLAALNRGALDQAFLTLAEANANASLARQGETAALLAHVLLQKGESQAAYDFLADPANPARNTPAVRLLRLRALIALPGVKPARLVEQLPYVNSADELAVLLQQLSPRRWGHVEFDPATQEIRGWVLDTRHPQTPVKLTLKLGDRQQTIVANLPSPLLAKSINGGRHGGIRLRLPAPLGRVRLCWADGSEVLGSPLAAVEALRPIPVEAPVESIDPVVDVLIPIYRGREASLACIQGVLDSLDANQTPMNVVVLDDESPEPELSQALRELAEAGRIELHRSPANLGFIRNMNRGMALHRARDVVWLNADARVCDDWLDRLREAAYSAAEVATATPFSNNGELLSFPESRRSHVMPTLDEQRALHRQAASDLSAPPEIEVGCGFCFYIKRRALEQVGLLDEIQLKRGYGEETDWCLRAKAQGWRHVAAQRVFVAHRGGVSFGAEKLERVAFNNAILRQRYPGAERAFERFYRHDPLKPYRQRLQRERLPELGAQLASANTRATIIAADRLDLLAALGGDEPAFVLAFRQTDAELGVSLRVHGQGLPVLLDYRLPLEMDQLITDLQRLRPSALGYIQPERCPALLQTLPARLDVPYRLIDPAADTGFPATGFREAASEQRVTFAALATALLMSNPQVPVATSASFASLDQPPTPRLGNILIADSLADPGLAQAWLQLVRLSRRQGLTCRFLLLERTPWEKSLLASGNVSPLIELPGIARSRIPALAGCTLALSLEAAPASAWFAPQIARHTALPLYAPAGVVATEVGAHPLGLLPAPLNALLGDALPDRFLHD
ncbi:glycosyltransferase family 2 protein [Pseudomonas oryzihabitans]|uniref:glycosyltransferase family 2 protein n=1 Tax=Pseudomonas oryzihabitans TaxID=47885 RepID=UPI0011A3AF94|nr:glycosyltransferase family 2 protein [Pseudomonas psychrotolerans]